MSSAGASSFPDSPPTAALRGRSPPLVNPQAAAARSRPAADLPSVQRAAAPGIVAPPYYDLPELKAAHEALWTRLRERLLQRGVEAPADIAAQAPSSPEPLLFGQVGGCRYMSDWAERLELLATPRRRLVGADGPFVRIAVLVRRGDPASGIGDLRGKRCAYASDDLDSVNLIRAEVASLARSGRFFGGLHPTGSFAAGAEAVAGDEADAALLDAVAYAHLQRLRPGVAGRLRVLHWTAQGPGAPFVTSKATSPAVAAALADALEEVLKDPAQKTLRGELLLEGSVRLPNAYYRAVLHFAQIAESQGFPALG